MAERTDHTGEISLLEMRSERLRMAAEEVRVPSAIPLVSGQMDRRQMAYHMETVAFANALAADLLEMHDKQGISLDNWDSARGLVEHLLGYSINENGV